MDGRRPRIKPSVNLQPKRKIEAVRSKQVSEQQQQQQTSSAASSALLSPKQQNSSEDINSVALRHDGDRISILDKKPKIENIGGEGGSSPFKRPPDIFRSPPYENNSFGDIDIQSLSTATEATATIATTPLPAEAAISENQQNEIGANYSSSQQSSSLSSLSLKHRQRIRPTPYFGGRRSSIQGSSINDLDDLEHMHRSRQRHLSESQQSISEQNNSNAITGSGGGGDSSIITSATTEGTIANNNVSSIHGNQKPSRYRKTSSSEDAFQKFVTTIKRNVSNKFNAKPPEKSAMTMLDFIYYNPSTNPMNSSNGGDEKSEQQPSDVTEENDVKEKSTTPAAETPASGGDDSNKVQENAPAMPVPQLKLGPNGEVIIDEKSLVIETTAEKEGKKNLLNSNILYLDDNTGNNGFYKRQKRTKDWTSEETVKFYRCLHTVGTDFSLMLTLFPNRTRRDLKLKFKKEEKTNLALINKALLYPKAFNVDELMVELKKDEKEFEEKRLKWNEIKNKKTIKKPKKDKASRNQHVSKIQRTLTEGDVAYSNVIINTNNENMIHIKEHNNYEKKMKYTITNKIKKCKMETATTKQEHNEFDADIDEQMIFETLINDADHDSHVGERKIQTSTIKFDSSDDFSNNQQQGKTNGIPDATATGTTDGCSSSDKYHLSDNILDDIDRILVELANGTLVLVTSEDSTNSKIINEIYVMCQETQQLSDKPLDLPEDVVNCIVSEAFK